MSSMMTKEEYRRSMNDIIYLCACAVNGERPDGELVKRMDLEVLYKVAQRHFLTAITAFALESMGIRDHAFSQAKAKAIRKVGLMDAEMNVLFEKLEKAGIWHMPLKGTILKDYYPEYGMRQMSDHDILFDPARAEKVKTIMEAMGYQVVSFGTGNHDVYHKEPVCNFEMHRALFGPSHDAKFQEYYRDMEKRIRKDADGGFGRHLSAEDFYVYMIAHEYKHYSMSGTGIRSLLDTYVYLKKERLDMGDVGREMDRLGIGEFEEKNRMLAEKLFTGGELSLDEEEMLQGYVFAGAYGTVAQRVENTIRKNGWGKLQYAVRRFLVPISRKNPDYCAYVKAYPVFYKCKLLILVLPLYRTFHAMKRGSFITELRAIRKARAKNGG